jgi:2-polyprenyl-3-methyl-5-hydroxy-6-metoxy-1,4-benzoquinol methylase
MVTKIGNIVQNFYNKSPFPDFELQRFMTRQELLLGARALPEMLNKQIPIGASVIDVGTGTGQLSAYLALNGRQVYGVDFSDTSLNKARALKHQLCLDTLHIKKIDILDTASIDSIPIKFDYVLCLGVLHHTGDAKTAFRNITRLLKPGGNIAIGLYNFYGRIPLKIRILLVKTMFRNNEKIKDYFIKLQIRDAVDKKRLNGWWNDQYMHPHETTHTVNEILCWFAENNIEYCQSLPSLHTREEGLDLDNFWDKTLSPSFFKRFVSQMMWIKDTHREGGFWITFGKNLPNGNLDVDM